MDRLSEVIRLMNEFLQREHQGRKPNRDGSRSKRTARNAAPTGGPRLEALCLLV
jgi:hypothetical protein